MFDDLPKKNPTPPNNLPSESDEPVDMFSDIDGGDNMVSKPKSALDNGILKEKNNLTTMQAHPDAIHADASSSEIYPTKSPVLGKIILVVIVLLIAGGVGYGAWKVYDFFNGSKSTSVEDDKLADENLGSIPEVIVTSTDQADKETAEPIDTTTAVVVDLDKQDTDKDGLSDAREIELKTDINNPDTDGDGLIDGDEVIIWNTDPSNPDTDGDSYFDGDEVKSGYNPLGTGKLFDNNTDILEVMPDLPDEATSSVSTGGTTSTENSSNQIEPDF